MDGMEEPSRQPDDEPTKSQSPSKHVRPNDATESADASIDAFISVNERPVDDISLDFFYKPHTITLLAVSILAMVYFAFVR